MSLAIPESVRALYPTSANRTIIVSNAWHPDKSTLERPDVNGSDGWEHIGEPATYAVLQRLQAAGYTHVNLYAGGTRRSMRDAEIGRLI